MFGEIAALTGMALKKRARNPDAVIQGLVTSAFYLALFASSFNQANLIPSNGSITPNILAAIKATFVSDALYLVGFAVVLGLLGYLVSKRALRPE